jgi:hypothetical protein
VNLSISVALLIEPKKERIMEALIFAIIAMRNGYKLQETIVPEPAEFQPFDLRALKRSYEAEENSSSRPSGRPKSFVAHVAS